MRKHLMKQVCGLALGVAGALAPLGMAQAADDYVDRYINGYLNDPYTNEVAPERASAFPAGVSSIEAGAQGPIRDDMSMKQESFRSDEPHEFYTGWKTEDTMGKARGAEGPIRESPAALDETATKPVARLPDHQFGELYDPPVRQ